MIVTVMGLGAVSQIISLLNECDEHDVAEVTTEFAGGYGCLKYRSGLALTLMLGFCFLVIASILAPLKLGGYKFVRPLGKFSCLVVESDRGRG